MKINNQVIIIRMDDLRFGCFRCLINPDRPCDYGKGKRDMKQFLTLGYGRTAMKAFRLRLLNVEKEYGKKLFIVDVRRCDSESRNGEWCKHPGDDTQAAYRTIGMAKTMGEATQDVMYTTEPLLANYKYRNTKTGLEKYRNDLRQDVTAERDTGYGLKYFLVGQPKVAFNRLLKGIRDLQHRNIIFVLMCSERKPYKTYKTKDGVIKISAIPNCHRIILAQELLDHLGGGWEVINL